MSNISVDKATIGLFNLQIVAKREFYLLEMEIISIVVKLVILKFYVKVIVRAII